MLCCCWIVVLYISWILISYNMICKYFHLFHRLSIQSLDSVLWCTKFLILIRSSWSTFSFVACVCFFGFSFFFLGLRPWHMEVPRLGVKSEQQLPAYTTAHSNVRFLTHWARPGIKPITSWFLVRFVSAAPQRELP